MRSKAGAFRFFPLPPISGLPEIGTNNWHKSDISDFVLERVATPDLIGGSRVRAYGLS